MNRNIYDSKYSSIVERYLISVGNGMLEEKALEKAYSELEEQKLGKMKSDFKKDIIEYRVKNDSIDIEPWRIETVEPDDIIELLERYSIISTGGNQWSIPDEIYQKISYEGDIFELFSSPINRSKHSKKWCSMYDKDKIFGSLGPYQKVPDYEFKDMIVIANPPFIEYVIEELIYKNISRINKNSNGLVLILPNWSDTKWYKFLEKYMNKIIKNTNEYSYYDYSSGKNVVARFETVVFTNISKLSYIFEEW